MVMCLIVEKFGFLVIVKLVCGGLSFGVIKVDGVDDFF